MTTRLKALALLPLLPLLALPASANDADPDAAIKYRQGVMKAIGGATGNIGATLKGEAGSPDQLAHLVTLLATAADPAYTVPAFKQNTDGEGVEKTTATAKIWENWDDFESRLNKLGEVTKAAAAAGADAGMDQMKPVFETCKGCHDEYREK